MDNPSPRLCEGCLRPLGPLDGRYVVCMDCTKARARGFAARRCVCPKAQKRPTEIMRAGSRTWISCHRCLRQIKQLS